MLNLKDRDSDRTSRLDEVSIGCRNWDSAAPGEIQVGSVVRCQLVTLGKRKDLSKDALSIPRIDLYAKSTELLGILK
jgi:hypothetical protein